MNHGYELIRLTNGTFSVRSTAHGETFHPVAGPIAEAEALYVRQLHLLERAVACRQRLAGEGRKCQQDAGGTLAGEFVIWDVGLGAGGNALTAIRQLANTNSQLRIISFDYTLDALRFAVQHAAELEFPIGLEEPIRTVLEQGKVSFQHGDFKVRWQISLGDFPALLADTAEDAWPTPHAIFFDAFSPARNPEMWTLPLFKNLFRRLAPDTPCSLATFSRSTLARTTMLLAGFFVGVGEPVAGKEETTIAANRIELLKQPLDLRWLERAKISRSAEPLSEPVYRQQPLKEETRERLYSHPQFQ